MLDITFQVPVEDLARYPTERRVLVERPEIVVERQVLPQCGIVAYCAYRRLTTYLDPRYGRITVGREVGEYLADITTERMPPRVLALTPNGAERRAAAARVFEPRRRLAQRYIRLGFPEDFTAQMTLMFAEAS